MSRQLTANLPSPTGAVDAKLRTNLEINLYRLAFIHAAEAAAAAKKGIEAANDQLEHALRAIILAAACLEAFINFEGMSAFGSNWDDYETGIGRAKNKRPSIEDKWHEVTQQITSSNTFDRGKRPFQGFKRLVGLRDYVMHYKVPMKPPVRSAMGNVAEARALINAQAAKTAVDSMKGMLIEYHRLTNKPLPPWVT